MGMTITEKILAKHAGLKEVQSGMLINAKVDIAMGPYRHRGIQESRGAQGL